MSDDYPIAVCVDPEAESADKLVGLVRTICGLVPTVTVSEDDPDLVPQNCVGAIGFGMPKVRRHCQREDIRVHMLPPDRDLNTLAWRFVPPLLEARSAILQGKFSETVAVQFRANLSRWPAEFTGRTGKRYVFLEPIGLGGTAIVGRFCDDEGNKYAAKTLSNHRFPKELTEDRFSREAELLARIDHPNVVRIVDQGNTRQGHVIVMEDLPAGSLHDRVGPSAPSLAVAVRWIREVLIGVGELHSREIVHRDLTPKNLLFREKGRLVVSDFGTVRHLDDETITNTADRLGSLIYSAPEQVAEPHGAGPPADVYSVGQIAFLLCTGITPHGNTGELGKHAAHVPREIAEVLESFRSYNLDDRPADGKVALRKLDEALRRHEERTQPWRHPIELCEEIFGPLQLIADQLLYSGQKSWLGTPEDAERLLQSILTAVKRSLSWVEEFEQEGGRLFALQSQDRGAALPEHSLGVVRGPRLHVEQGLSDEDGEGWVVWGGTNQLVMQLTEWRKELLAGEVALLPSELLVHLSGPVESTEESLEVESVWTRIQPVPPLSKS